MSLEAAAQARHTPIFVERRFPLDLTRRLPSISDLYEEAKVGRWSPERAVPWSELDASRYDDETRRAAALAWSRRAWIEEAGIAETPAVLIRFCLEVGREADPKYFLTVRGTEEAWHLEVMHRITAAFGGLVPAPEDAGYAALFNRGVFRTVLDAEESLDVHVATHCAFEDGLERELYRACLEHADNPVLARALELILADKSRHAAFGWTYLKERAPQWPAETAAAIAASIVRFVEVVECRGYHCPSLGGAPSKLLADAEARAADAGLGCLPPERERDVFGRYVGEAREQLAGLGIELPPVAHDALGTV